MLSASNIKLLSEGPSHMETSTCAEGMCSKLTKQIYTFASTKIHVCNVSIQYSDDKMLQQHIQNPPKSTLILGNFLEGENGEFN